VKKLAVTIFIILFTYSAMPVYAQAQGGVSSDSIFNRMADWFATVGKSQEEKYRIKHERRTARKINKVKKRIAKQKRDIAKKKKAFNN